MSYPETPIDKVGLELHQLARAYAARAAQEASDPYFREAVLRASVSGFVWALYHAFDEHERAILNDELKTQSTVVDRALNGDGSNVED